MATRFRITTTNTPVSVTQSAGSKCVIVLTTDQADTAATAGGVNTSGQGSRRPKLVGWGIYSGTPSTGTVYRVKCTLCYTTSSETGTEADPVPLDPRHTGTPRAGGVVAPSSGTPAKGSILKVVHIAGNGGYEYLSPPGLEEILDADTSGKSRIALFAEVTADAGATAAEITAYFMFEE